MDENFKDDLIILLSKKLKKRKIITAEEAVIYMINGGICVDENGNEVHWDKDDKWFKYKKFSGFSRHGSFENLSKIK